MTDPRFDERQVALILQRTAELQRAKDLAADAGRVPAALATGDGERRLSLSQLEQIAGEAGMDPRLVRRAAGDVRAVEAAPRNWFFGDATQVIVERTIAGELPTDALDGVLVVVRATAGDLGEVSIVGQSAGWRGRIDRSRAQVAVTSAAGRTTIRVQVALDEVAVGEFMAFFTGFGIVGAFVTTAFTAAALGALTILAAGPVAVAGYAVARRHFKAAANKARARAADIADQVAAHVESLSS